MNTKTLASVVAVIGIGVVVAVEANNSGGGGSSSPVPIGTAIPFSFNNGGTASITVDGIVAPANPGQYELPPTTGDEYVGVRITVKNTGSTNLFVNLGPITSLTDTSGQSYSSTVATLSDCPTLGNPAGLATIAPGSSTTGCIAFEVPSGETFARVAIGSSGRTPGIWSVQ